MCKLWHILSLDRGFARVLGTLLSLNHGYATIPEARLRSFYQIPDRLYFKIGDVARICAVETYVLRFWESQFPQLKPQ